MCGATQLGDKIVYTRIRDVVRCLSGQHANALRSSRNREYTCFNFAVNVLHNKRALCNVVVTVVSWSIYIAQVT